ncbi:glutamate--tRNA ligase [Haloquadratum walsbyi]|uniref:glutamate--tRNA ligase n=1 Tax=Haloquadratum walsbyi TaxID=293091 RepID=UPI00064FF379|nr:glutamate--tRNA ligase [Haloquadratum walsbyi]
MDDELRDRIERSAEKHALLNAVKHNSDAEMGAIMGPLMGENPEFRPHGDAIPGIIGSVVSQINNLSAGERRDRLETLAPEALKEIESADNSNKYDLPSLPGVTDKEPTQSVRMRAAPNPNGPWHIGHARMPAVIGTYSNRYDGSFIIRFDDTDPETKRPDLNAYDDILEDVTYLGFEPDDVLRASDRLELYYDYAQDLIDVGGAYTCSCSGEHFSELKNAGEACPHREKSIDQTRTEFEAMIQGEYVAGEMVLRVRTDIKHKNPALRDWVAFRLIDTPHPRASAADYRCWPMLDFQSGIDDHETGITHIIRGIDLQDSAKRQRFVYNYFDWEYPEVVHWGHINVDAYDVSLSTSTLTEKIEGDELDGWDDPRAPTLQSLRRRGITGEAIVESMINLGTSTTNVELSMSSIYSNNRKHIDDEANRYFLVRNGESFTLDTTSGDMTAGHPPLHPDNPERGERTIPITDAITIESADVPVDGNRVWLKGYACVQRDGNQFRPTDDSIDVVREDEVNVIHWAPAPDSSSAISVRMRTPDGDITGVAEPELINTSVGDLVQFERVGFARIDSKHEQTTNTDMTVYWTHS